MSAVLNQPASATVRAVDDLQVRVIHDPMKFLSSRPGAALAVLRTTASRLDGLTHYLVDVKQQFADEEGHLGMVDRVIDHLVHHQGPTARTGSARDPEGDHDHDHSEPACDPIRPDSGFPTRRPRTSGQCRRRCPR